MQPTEVGKLIKDEWTPERDAIHIAVLPAKAAQRLYSRDRVDVFRLDGEWCAFCPMEGPDYDQDQDGPSGIGIIDPYLKYPLEKGDRFWVFVDPGTITDMTHAWQHPSLRFDTADEPDSRNAEEVSLAFMEKLGNVLHLTPNEMIKAGLEYQATWEHHELKISTPYEFVCREGSFDDFWKHWSILTGRTVDKNNSSPFSCRC